MQVIIHQIANQRWTVIWTWRVISISRFGNVQCYATYIWITIYFSSIPQTCAPFPVMKHNVHQCSLMADSQSLASWLGQLSGLTALAAQSCMLRMGLRKHGLTHWDPRSTGLANQLIDHWLVRKKLPPYLAYVLWNCSGVDVNNQESILVMTWHRQAAFRIQYGIF